jgi:hypothetical protein
MRPRKVYSFQIWPNSWFEEPLARVKVLCYRTHLEGPDHPVLAHPGGRLPAGEQEQGQHLQVSSLEFDFGSFLYPLLDPDLVSRSEFRIRTL